MLLNNITAIVKSRNFEKFFDNPVVITCLQMKLNDTDELEMRVAQLEEDVANLEVDVTDLEVDVTDLEADVVQLTDEVDEVEDENIVQTEQLFAAQQDISGSSFLHN